LLRHDTLGGGEQRPLVGTQQLYRHRTLTISELGKPLRLGPTESNRHVGNAGRIADGRAHLPADDPERQI